MLEKYITKTGVSFTIQYSGLLARSGDYYAGLFIVVEDSSNKKSAIKIKVSGTLLHSYWDIPRGGSTEAEQYLIKVGLLKIKIAVEKSDLPFFTDEEISAKPRDFDREFVFLASPEKITFKEQILRMSEELEFVHK